MREEPHATAAVLRSTQAAVSDSVFPACVGRARRSVLLRFARPAEANPADNATERIAAGGRSRCAPEMSARRRRRITMFRSDHAMLLAIRIRSARRKRTVVSSHPTRRWREMDSNLRFPDRSAPVVETASPVFHHDLTVSPPGTESSNPFPQRGVGWEPDCRQGHMRPTI